MWICAIVSSTLSCYALSSNESIRRLWACTQTLCKSSKLASRSVSISKRQSKWRTTKLQDVLMTRRKQLPFERKNDDWRRWQKRPSLCLAFESMICVSADADANHLFHVSTRPINKLIWTWTMNVFKRLLHRVSVSTTQDVNDDRRVDWNYFTCTSERINFTLKSRK